MSNHFKTINSPNLTLMSKIRIKQVVIPVSESMIKKVRNSLSIGKQETNTSTKSKLLSNVEKIMNSPSLKYLGSMPLYSYSNKNNNKSNPYLEIEEPSPLLSNIKNLTPRQLNLINPAVSKWKRPTEIKSKTITAKLKVGQHSNSKPFPNSKNLQIKNLSSNSSISLHNNKNTVRRNPQPKYPKSPGDRGNPNYINYQLQTDKAIKSKETRTMSKSPISSGPKLRNHNYKSMSAVIVKQENNYLGKAGLYTENKTVPELEASDLETNQQLLLLKSRASSIISKYYELTCIMTNK